MFDINQGIIITGVAMLIFYLRLAMLRGQKRRLAREEALHRRKDSRGKSKPIELVERPTYHIWSWWLVGAGAAMMCVGVMMYTAPWFNTPYNDFWYVATSIGVLLFTASFSSPSEKG